MKSLHFRYLLNKHVNLSISLLSLFVVVAIFGCKQSRSENGQGLRGFRAFKVARHSILLPDGNGADYVRFRFLPYDTVLQIWDLTEQHLMLYDGEFSFLKRLLKINEITDNRSVSDVLYQDNKLYISFTQNNEFEIYDLINNRVEKSYRIHPIEYDEDLLVIGSSYIPLTVEDSLIYLGVTDSRNNRYLVDSIQQMKFFSFPLEERYNMLSGKSLEFGSYPFRYTAQVMDFYDWPARRTRLNQKSIYSFAHIDSLYSYSDFNRISKSILRKSYLNRKALKHLDKSRLTDYEYLTDYYFLNDHYSDIIADPYRNLVYSIFVPGVNPPEDHRLKPNDIAFTVIVYNADLEFQKEIFFPAGEYDNRFHFVTPNGLCIQTTASGRSDKRIFDVFDFTKRGATLGETPAVYEFSRKHVSLTVYLRDSIGISPNIDSVIVISGLGCTGCLESYIQKAENSGVNLNRYAYVATGHASQIQTVGHFLSDRTSTYIDKSDELSNYRIMGDFLTLVVLKGDSVVSIDKNFDLIP